MIKELIKEVHQNDVKALNDLIEMFRPLLSKYARKINMEYEDSLNELICEFIVLLKSESIGRINSDSDPIYIAYIQKSIIHSFIKINKKVNVVNREMPTSNLSTEVQYQIECDTSCVDDYLVIELKVFKTILTVNEYNIISMYFYEDKNINIIANELNISKQTVNQTKLRALRKLKSYINAKM